MDTEERCEAEIEQGDAKTHQIVSKNQVKQKKNGKHLLQISIGLPFLGELRFGRLKHLENLYRRVPILLIEPFLHFHCIHKHTMRQYHIEPLDQLMHIEAFASFFRTENIHIIQL